jgi:cobalt/nickel transport system permease protein
MHIPDGFLSPPVWATLDVAAVPAVAWAARQAQTDLECSAESSDARRIPLLGVMGAFVFAAQMINFPVGLGTSGHLVGGALLAIALGPATAATVMTAVLILQAFILQDGGIMALGANILNMAIAGVLAGYLPYRLWGRGRTRQAAIFLGGFVSVALSATLALSELIASGVPMPRRLVLISSFLFLANGLIEGAITVAAVRAIERLNPGWVRATEPLRPRSVMVVAIGAAVLVGLGAAIASTAPDALEAALSVRGEAHSALFDKATLHKALFGLTGMAILYAGLLLVSRRFARQRSARFAP